MPTRAHQGWKKYMLLTPMSIGLLKDSRGEGESNARICPFVLVSQVVPSYPR